MIDFRFDIYKKLLKTLLNQQYSFEFQHAVSRNHSQKVVILRHDVDRLPANSLAAALIENDLGIKSIYNFRIVKESYHETIIKKIADLGHEIGYHYEDLSLCNGDHEAAIKQFEKNLAQFRTLYPVKTICMHGSPLSKWDNRDLWKRYDYRDFGIIAEPYFDLDFNEVFYLTDTGRRWNGEDVSVRDRVNTKNKTDTRLKFKSTMDIIAAAESGFLPDKLMITTHPQRWDDRFFPWAKELVWQNMKNVIKKWVYVGKNKSS